MDTITLPDADELTRRLVAINDEPHLVERFYPRLARYAGQERTGMGVGMSLVLASDDYTRGLPSVVAVQMRMILHTFVPALTDDEGAQGDALAFLARAGLPVHKD